MSDYKINLDNRTESKFSLFMFHLCFISCIRSGKMEAKSRIVVTGIRGPIKSQFITLAIT